MPDSMFTEWEDMVKIKLSPTELQTIDRLVKAGSFRTREEAISWLVTEGLRTIPIQRISARVRQITDIDGTTRRARELREEGCSDLDTWWQVTHERLIQAYGWPSTRLLRRRKKGQGPVWKYGGSLFGDEQTPLGIDYDRRLIIANYGKTKIRLDKHRYTKAEKDLIRLAVKSLEQQLETRPREERLRTELPDFESTEELFGGLLEEAREALKR